ncbi:MAG: nucleotide exchange factor GrpE [Deltaproteobacteria bacterium]
MSEAEKTEENAVPITGVAGVPEDAEEAPAPLTLAEALEQVRALEAEIGSKAEESAANHDLFLRERAELENFKRRLMREKADALRFASSGLLRDLLGSLDNLELAVAHAEGENAVAALREGVELVLKDLRGTFERHGVTRIEATGKPFDPAVHEALAQIPTTLATAGHVMDEHRPGYQLHDRLLRAAQVTVAQAPTPETEEK